jgi:uncharacterized repeat protein (TIGR03806 family)
MQTLRLITTALLCVTLAACGPPEPQLHAEDAVPENLADWGLIYRDGGSLVWADASAVYDLTTPLFTDYAHKLRTVHVPQGAQIAGDDAGRLRYPVGTVFTKTFYYPKGEAPGQVRKVEFASLDDRGLELRDYRILETRLLVHYESGWKALVYVWDEDQQNARRKITGALFPLTLLGSEGDQQDFAYVVPDANQCQSCHATAFDTRRAEPIGPARADFINRDSPLGSGNQLADWHERGWLATRPDNWPSATEWRNTSESVEARARAYLDINCAHCHSETGAGDTSGLWLDRTASGVHLGWCKPPIAAGQGTGGRRWGIDPGHPDNSILTYRMASRDPGAMMPELGRSLVHEEGLALVRDWITGLEGTCE